MKSIGDLDDIRAHSGLKGAIRAVLTCPLFFFGVRFLAMAFFSLLFALNHLNLSLVAPQRIADTRHQRNRGKNLPKRKCRPPPLDRRCPRLHRRLLARPLSSESGNRSVGG
jgi:hypothetical protein